MRARVLITPKPGILDPQGQAVERALPALGFTGVRNVSVGRLIELDVEAPAELPAMCERLLTNPLVEDYEIVEDLPLRFGVIRFPGSCDEVDAQLACERVGEAVILWHGDPDLHGVDAVVVPGGFSYGDYLRPGAIARFAPVMASVARFAADGGLVLGICNGFQVLCEAGLLPGALLSNAHLRFRFRQVNLEVVDPGTSFTRNCPPGRPLSIPTKHASGRYYAPDPGAVHVVLRYAPGENPNGSANDIAGVVNDAGNVFGLMPHPEHAVDALTGSTDGLTIFESMRAAVEDRVAA